MGVLPRSTTKGRSPTEQVRGTLAAEACWQAGFSRLCDKECARFRVVIEVASDSARNKPYTWVHTAILDNLAEHSGDSHDHAG